MHACKNQNSTTVQIKQGIKREKPCREERWQRTHLKLPQLLNLFFHCGPEEGHPLPRRSQKWKSGSLRTRLPFFSPSLPTSLRYMARLAPCYHGNKDCCDTVRTVEGEKRGGVGGKSPPAVQYRQQKPWGNLVGDADREEFISNFIAHSIFVLQHKHGLVLPVLLLPICGVIQLLSLLPPSQSLLPLSIILTRFTHPSFLSSPPSCSTPWNAPVMTVVWSTVAREKLQLEKRHSWLFQENEEPLPSRGVSTLQEMCQNELILLGFIYTLTSVITKRETNFNSML